MKARSSRIRYADALASARNARSAKKSHADGAAATAPGGPACSSGLITARLPASPQNSLNVGGRFLHDAGDTLRQWDVTHLRADLLTLGEAVVDQLAQRRSLLGIRVLLVEQEPGIGRDRVRLWPFRIG